MFKVSYLLKDKWKKIFAIKKGLVNLFIEFSQAIKEKFETINKMNKEYERNSWKTNFI